MGDADGSRHCLLCVTLIVMSNRKEQKSRQPRFANNIDEFLRSRSSVHGVRFIGLLLLGFSFLGGGITITLFVISKLRLAHAGLPLIGVAVVYCLPMSIVGCLYLRRAFAGKLRIF